MSVKKPVETVQESFLVHLKQTEEAITIFLVNGVKLQGVIAGFDQSSILLRRDGHVQLVYKHAVSTIMPVVALSGFLARLAETSSAGEF